MSSEGGRADRDEDEHLKSMGRGEGEEQRGGGRRQLNVISTAGK